MGRPATNGDEREVKEKSRPHTHSATLNEHRALFLLLLIAHAHVRLRVIVHTQCIWVYRSPKIPLRWFTKGNAMTDHALRGLDVSHNVVAPLLPSVRERTDRRMSLSIRGRHTIDLSGDGSRSLTFPNGESSSKQLAVHRIKLLICTGKTPSVDNIRQVLVVIG